jgi:tetratricopeptide (TPR) repeat protein
MYSLKSLTKEGVPRALQKAERYRLLNEPWEAESICRDVLEIEPDNHEAQVGLMLAITDQFGHVGGVGFDEARQLAEGLPDEYERAYYLGILCERRAKVHYERANPGRGVMAHEWYTKAMEYFEQADKLHPTGNEDATLRWNTCARMLMKHPDIRAAEHDHAEHMLE